MYSDKIIAQLPLSKAYELQILNEDRERDSKFQNSYNIDILMNR